MVKAKQRAKDAQVEFYQLITAPFRDRDKFANALCSVVETARVAARNTGGIEVTHGHRSMREAQPNRWAELESSAWDVVCAGNPGVIWAELEKQMRKIGLHVEPLSDIAEASAEKHSHAA